MSDVVWVIYEDGAILGRRPFGSGTIAKQRLQFSSSLGVAFAISSQRTPQVIVYEETSDK